MNLGVIVRGKVFNPLRIKRIWLFAYFLDVVFEGQWQDIFAEAGMMRKSSGEPIRAREWSRELAKANDDRKILMQESMTYGFRVEQMRESKVERLRYYIEVDEAFRAVTRG